MILMGTCNTCLPSSLLIYMKKKRSIFFLLLGEGSVNRLSWQHCAWALPWENVSAPGMPNANLLIGQTPITAAHVSLPCMDPQGCCQLGNGKPGVTGANVPSSVTPCSPGLSSCGLKLGWFRNNLLLAPFLWVKSWLFSPLSCFLAFLKIKPKANPLPVLEHMPGTSDRPEQGLAFGFFFL